MSPERRPDDPVPAWVALGSNLGEPAARIAQALEALDDLACASLEAVSRYYRNPPMGPQAQPDYVNAVARLRVGCSPLELLDELQAIEAAIGRRRGGVRWGARRIDLDLVLYGECRIGHPRLQVPHPGLPRRAFVLYPLADIDPQVAIPGQPPLEALLAQVDGGGLEVLED